MSSPCASLSVPHRIRCSCVISLNLILAPLVPLLTIVPASAQTETNPQLVVTQQSDDGLLSTRGAFEPGFWETGGLYLGAQLGYSLGQVRNSGGNVGSKSDDYDLSNAGLRAGYLFPLGRQWSFGLEGVASFPYFLAGSDTLGHVVGLQHSVEEHLDCVGNLRGNLGYARGRWRWSVLGGVAGERLKFTSTDIAEDAATTTTAHLAMGYVLGLGTSLGLARHWVVSLESLYEAMSWDGGGTGDEIQSSSTRGVSFYMGLSWVQ